MKIDRNNYEIFFIDYIDGNLNREEKEEVLRFLSENPDLKNEFETFEKLHGNSDENSYAFKNDLKKQVGDLGPVDDDTIDEYCIAFMEDDLNEGEKQMLIEAIDKNDTYQRTFRLYQLTKLEPDYSVIYKYKGQLKHVSLNRKTVLRYVGVASAAAVILLGIFRINPSDDDPNVDHLISETTEMVDTTDTMINKQKNENDSKNFETHIVYHEESVKSVSLQHEDVIAVVSRLDPIPKLQPKELQTLEFEWEAKIKVNTEIRKPEMLASTEEKPDDSLPPEVLALTKESRKLDLWTLAELGVKVIGALNERNLSFKPNYNSSGDVKSVTVTTEQRKITAPAI